MSDSPPTFRRRLGWRAETLAYDVVSALVRTLPVDTASAMGSAIVGTLGPLTGKHRIVLRGLELAFPEKTPEEREAIAREFWRKVGRTFAEFPLMDRITPATGRIEVVGVRFQQIQKYECGANRISAARLWQLSEALEVPINYFYDGLSDRIHHEMPHERAEAPGEMLARKETQDLIRAYYQLGERPRRRLLDLAKSLNTELEAS